MKLLRIPVCINGKPGIATARGSISPPQPLYASRLSRKCDALSEEQARHARLRSAYQWRTFWAACLLWLSAAAAVCAVAWLLALYFL